MYFVADTGVGTGAGSEYPMVFDALRRVCSCLGSTVFIFEFSFFVCRFDGVQTVSTA